MKIRLVILFLSLSLASVLNSKAYMLNFRPQGRHFKITNNVISLVPSNLMNQPYSYQVPMVVNLQEIRFMSTVQWGFQVPGTNLFFMPKDQDYFRQIYYYQPPASTQPRNVQTKTPPPPKDPTQNTQPRPSPDTNVKKPPPNPEVFSLEDCLAGKLKSFSYLGPQTSQNTEVNDQSYFSSCSSYAVSSGITALIANTYKNNDFGDMLPEYYFLSAIEKSIHSPEEFRTRIHLYKQNRGFFEHGIKTAFSLNSTLDDIKASKELIGTLTTFNSKSAQRLLSILNDKIRTLYSEANTALQGAENFETLPYLDKEGINMSLEQRVKNLIAEAKVEMLNNSRRTPLPIESVSGLNTLLIHNGNTMNKRDRFFCDTKHLKQQFLHILCQKHPVIVGEVSGFETMHEKHSLLLSGYHIDSDGELFFDFKNPDPNNPSPSIHADSLCDIGIALVPYLQSTDIKKLLPSPKTPRNRGPYPKKSLTHNGSKNENE